MKKTLFSLTVSTTSQHAITATSLEGTSPRLMIVVGDPAKLSVSATWRRAPSVGSGEGNLIRGLYGAGQKTSVGRASRSTVAEADFASPLRE